MNTKSGKQLHPIGIGTWGIASRINPAIPTGQYRGVEPVRGSEEAEVEAIRYSLSKGQNHLDCAEMYGGFYTDEVIGQALADSHRDDLYIADKLWKTSVASGQVRPTVERMLQKLQTTYIDLLYIHAPFDDAPWEEAIPQIDALIDEGLVRQFGVSNFTVTDMEQAMQLSRHPLAANQMNYNVLHQNEANEQFRAFCNQHNIQLVAYQPVKRQAVIDNETIQMIAQHHNATPAQVALAWLLNKGALPIPKATQQAHIDENLLALELTLTAEDLERLDSLDSQDK